MQDSLTFVIGLFTFLGIMASIAGWFVKQNMDTLKEQIELANKRAAAAEEHYQTNLYSSLDERIEISEKEIERLRTERTKEAEVVTASLKELQSINRRLSIGLRSLEIKREIFGDLLKNTKDEETQERIIQQLLEALERNTDALKRVTDEAYSELDGPEGILVALKNRRSVQE